MGSPSPKEQLLIDSLDCCVYLREFEIRSLIRRRNMTLTEFAKRLKTSKNHTWQLLKRYRMVSPNMRKKIMEQFPEKDWDDLFEESLG